VLSARFDQSAQGFAFTAGGFRGGAASRFATGQFSASGGASGGGLVLALGGIDDTPAQAIGGGFSRTFTLASTAALTVRLQVRVTQSPNYEADEFSEALLALDGRLIGAGGKDFLARIAGDGNGGAPRSTGWITVTVPLGTVPAGTHTLRIGGFNSKKTLTDERTEIAIDDVTIAR
jgi:hypothetical protein